MSVQAVQRPTTFGFKTNRSLKLLQHTTLRAPKTRVTKTTTALSVSSSLAGVACGAALLLSPVTIHLSPTPTVNQVYAVAQDTGEEYEEIPQIESEILEAESSETEAAVEKELEAVEVEMTKLDEQTEKGIDESEIEEEASGILQQLQSLKSILGLS
eukprot:TRINITY_DN387_c0_g1_i5.p2 TRINITY_DN387_c0_g1~~TRINITY_DN387_c0_g1_i5.p2  ORF type:complete len:157 (-),score=28.73 TRINITY_DN387_c0_g1_i5:110-580(-)